MCSIQLLLIPNGKLGYVSSNDLIQIFLLPQTDCRLLTQARLVQVCSQVFSQHWSDGESTHVH